MTLTITPGTGTAGAVLTCTANPKAAAAGVATFAACKIDKAGTGYTLTATATGLTTTSSTPFDVAVGPATKLVYTPTAHIDRRRFDDQPRRRGHGARRRREYRHVQQRDHQRSQSAPTPAAGPSREPSRSTPPTAVATFADLSINKSGTGYTLTMTSTGLTSATSTTFNVTVGAAAKLGFTQQPSGGSRGHRLGHATQGCRSKTPQGNTVTTSTASVTLTITPGTGTAGAVLTCTANPKAAASGVATFAGCKINLAGTGYTLTATSPGLTNATSNTFTIT